MSASMYQRLHGWSALVGLAGFAWCSFNHMCCGGHIQHPRYPWWHYSTDGIWVAGFALAAMCGFACRPVFVAVPVLLAVLAASRLVTDSGSGFFLILELPAALVATGLALAAVGGRIRGVAAVETLAWPTGLSDNENP